MFRTAFSKFSYTQNVFVFAKPSFLLILFVQMYFVSAAQIPVRPKLAIQLLLNTNGGPQNTADGVAAFYADNFSTAVGNEDSYKWTNPDENLAINSKGKLLSIEGRPTIHGSDTLNLVMWQFRQKSYYLQLYASNFAQSVKAVVKDNYLHKETAVNLSSVTLVPFGITTDSASFAANRFTVVFKTLRALPLSSKLKFISVFKESLSLSVSPNPVTGNVISLQLNNLKKGRYAVSIYSNNGGIIYSGFMVHDGGSATQTIVIDKRIHRGMYRLQLTCGPETITRNVLFQ